MEMDNYKLKRDLRRYRFLRAAMHDPLSLLILDGLVKEVCENLRAIGAARTRRYPSAAKAPRH
jgi:hypothetical protein